MTKDTLDAVKEISRRIQKTYVADYFPDVDTKAIDRMLKEMKRMEANWIPIAQHHNEKCTCMAIL